MAPGPNDKPEPAAVDEHARPPKQPGLAVNEAATQAAREGAAGITPVFDQLSKDEQLFVTEALEMNDATRLLDILKTHARTLTRAELDAILAE